MKSDMILWSASVSALWEFPTIANPSEMFRLDTPVTDRLVFKSRVFKLKFEVSFCKLQ